MKQITNQIQIEKAQIVRRTALERIVKPEIEFQTIDITRNLGYNVNRAD
jgi:hypothetical protein